TGTTPDHLVLRAMHRQLQGRQGEPLGDRIGGLRDVGWTMVVEDMVARGMLGRETPRGRPARHPVLDADARAGWLADLHAAAGGSAPLDERTAALLAVADSCGMLDLAVPGRGGVRDARRRIAEVLERSPDGAAVGHVVAAVANY